MRRGFFFALIVSIGLALGIATPAFAEGDDDMNAAVEALRAREYDRAATLFSQVLVQDDLSAAARLRAYRGRAHAYHQLRKFRLAVADYSRAIDLRPGLADVWNSRCWSRIYVDQPRAAIEDCDMALKIDPKFGAAYDSRAMAYSGAGDYDKALEDHNRALERARIAEHFYNRAITEKRKGDDAAAERDFAQARKLANDQAHWESIVHEMEPLYPAAPAVAPPTPPAPAASPATTPQQRQPSAREPAPAEPETRKHQ